MKKYNILSSLLLAAVFAFLFPMTVSANSSWQWISETRPYDILPVVVIITLLIEILTISFIPRVKALPKVVFFVVLANILSFAAPYVFLYFTSSLYTFEQALERMPYYTVGIVYLIVTLIVEIPTVFLGLKKSANNSKKLLLTAIGANVVTTVLTAVVERIFCRGSW